MKPSPVLLSGICLSLMLAGVPLQAAYAWLPAAPDVVGSWQGTLTVPGGQLRIVFHIKSADDGLLSATLDSPNQGAFGIPVSRVTVAGDTLRLEVQAIGGHFEGVIRADESAIDGTWGYRAENFDEQQQVIQMGRPELPERAHESSLRIGT